MLPAEIAQAVKRVQFITGRQVADVMAWLLGDGAARLTGQVIAVDGGFTTVRPLVK